MTERLSGSSLLHTDLRLRKLELRLVARLSDDTEYEKWRDLTSSFWFFLKSLSTASSSRSFIDLVSPAPLYLFLYKAPDVTISSRDCNEAIDDLQRAPFELGIDIVSKPPLEILLRHNLSLGFKSIALVERPRTFLPCLPYPTMSRNTIMRIKVLSQIWYCF